MIRAHSLAAALGLAALAACSSSSSSPTEADGGNDGAAPPGADAGWPGTHDAATAADASANCVPPGYMGNEKGVGAYCDANTSCPFKGTFLVCTAGHGAPADESFCTTPCSHDSECGTGAYCVHDTGGSGCVPTQCGGAPSAADAAAD